MDPAIVKMIQLLVAETFGGVLLLAGAFFIYRGLSGGMTIAVHAVGVRAKLINASPGVVVAGIGLLLVLRSLSISVVTSTTTAEGDRTILLDRWLANSALVTGKEPLSELVSKLAGQDSSSFRIRAWVASQRTTLGEVSREQYGDPKYWKVLAATNLFRGYFSASAASASTVVEPHWVLDIWDISKFTHKTSQEIIRVKVADARAVYNSLLALQQSGKVFGADVTFDQLSDSLKAVEIQLSLAPADLSGGVSSLGDLALKWFGGKQYWPLIVWTNPDAFGGVRPSQDTAIPAKPLLLLRVITGL